MTKRYRMKRDYCPYFDLDWLKEGTQDEILDSIFPTVYNEKGFFFDWFQWYFGDLSIDTICDQLNLRDAGSSIRISYRDYCTVRTLDLFEESYEVVEDGGSI